MEVVLLADVKNIGKRGEVKKVSDGYARNLLLPRKLAVVATAALKVRAERTQHHEQEAIKSQQSRQQKIASKLDGYTVVVKAKTSSGGTLFAAVTDKQVAQKLKEQQGIDVLPDDINMDKPIKKVGKHSASISVSGSEKQVTLDVKAL